MRIWNKISISLEQKRNYPGYLFIMPFLLGFLFFYLYPFILSFIFSISELSITSEGYNLNYMGYENYHFSLFVHTDFVRIFVDTTNEMLSKVPLIITFAFFAAILLNQNFKGRSLARVIFFMPVIMGAGIVLRLEQDNLLFEIMEQSDEAQRVLELNLGGTAALRAFLYQMRFPEVFIEYLIMAVDEIPEIIRSSGVQILIFLAGLKAIPESLYEASKIEGATSWENFWKITFPLMTPIILTNFVYTVIDSYTAPYNEMVDLIKNTAFGGAGYGVSTAMAWIYFLAIVIILLIFIKIISRYVFYYQ